MTDRARLPITPRRLQISLACLYVGVSETKFRALVDSGDIARPKRIGRNVGWDIVDLDIYVDNLPRDGEPANDDWQGIAI